MPTLADIKNWNIEIETAITTRWRESEHFVFNPKTTKPIYSIDTPPPYINAPIHMGHAITYCFMDMFARYKRMKGFEVLFPLGLDNNGLPIEMGAEKTYKISALTMPRGEFLAYCKKLLAECSAASVDSFAQLGVSFSSYKEGNTIGSIYKTDAPEYRALTQKTFIDLYKRGVVYEDNRINNWDPKLRTTIADSEIEYKDIASTFNDITWRVTETGETITIGTTRPELICSCGMVIYNPQDTRYQHLEGKHAKTPLFDIEVPIKAHPLADPKKGTGLVMMCSAGDLSDIQFFREQNLEPIISIDIDGRMNDNAGPYKGLSVRDARKKMLADLKTQGLLVKQEPITHRTPLSERSGAEIEFIAMPEFYLKQLDIKEDIRNLAQQDITFYPESSRKILEDWIDAISIDWPISRRRFYATEIPLWHAEKDGVAYVALPTTMRYYQPWQEPVPHDAEVWSDGKSVGVAKHFSDLSWIGETRVFDTWMDSSISELFILHYQTNKDFFTQAYPASLRPQGKEIVRTWLYYTLLRGYLETGRACFHDVWIHQHILDEKGRKMSKSAGNVVDPQTLLREHGAEAIRFWAATEGDLSKGDFLCSTTRIAAEKKTLNKLLNISRFVHLFEKPAKKPRLTPLDALFVSYIEGLTTQCDEQYGNYDFNHPAQELRRFLWETFASHYIELVKSRAYNESKTFSEAEHASARYTLHLLHERLLYLLYPIIPQITSVIAQEKKINLLVAPWPKTQPVNDVASTAATIEAIMAFNSSVWKAKKDTGISLKESLSGITIPQELEMYASDLRACHAISS